MLQRNGSLESSGVDINVFWMDFFNFHTHNIEETCGIINLTEPAKFQQGKKYSLGLHPWYCDDTSIYKIPEIEKACEDDAVVLIGETGFDKKSHLNIYNQTKIFEEHVRISERLRKPLIIHCVKQYNHLVEIKKFYKPAQPWILHGFTGKLSNLDILLKSDIYLSVSYNLLVDDKKSEKFFEIVPRDRLFFETDDARFPVENVYKSASRWLKAPLDEVCQFVNENISRIGLL